MWSWYWKELHNLLLLSYYDHCDSSDNDEDDHDYYGETSTSLTLAATVCVHRIFSRLPRRPRLGSRFQGLGVKGPSKPATDMRDPGP